MATSSKHRGFNENDAHTRLEALYNGTEVFDFDADDVAFTAAVSFAGALDINAATNVSGEAEFAGNVHLQDTVELSNGVGSDGEQFTSGGAGAACDWTAASSLRQFKKVLGLRTDEQEVLERLLGTPVYDFQYKSKDEADGRLTTTGDTETVYTGIMADEAPYLMHYKGRILNPINTVGYLLMGIKALAARVEELEARRA